MKAFVLPAVFTLASLPCVAQGSPATAYRLSFSYDRPGLSVPHWQLTVPQRGPAVYTGKPEKGNDPGEVVVPLSDKGRSHLADLMVHSHGMQPCETKSKGIANMGMKVVEFEPADEPRQSCTYNYTENKALNEAADYVMAIADTVQAGLELERLHRYDRLGMDAVMVRLVEDVKQGRAAEIGAIRPTLESLVADVALLDRVRNRAQQLLDLAKQQDNSLAQ